MKPLIAGLKRKLAAAVRNLEPSDITALPITALILMF